MDQLEAEEEEAIEAVELEDEDLPAVTIVMKQVIWQEIALYQESLGVLIAESILMLQKNALT